MKESLKFTLAIIVQVGKIFNSLGLVESNFDYNMQWLCDIHIINKH